MNMWRLCRIYQWQSSVEDIIEDTRQGSQDKSRFSSKPACAAYREFQASPSYRVQNPAPTKEA